MINEIEGYGILICWFNFSKVDLIGMRVYMNCEWFCYCYYNEL